jgi:hypothetical protein
MKRVPRNLAPGVAVDSVGVVVAEVAEAVSETAGNTYTHI